LTKTPENELRKSERRVYNALSLMHSAVNEVSLCLWRCSICLKLLLENQFSEIESLILLQIVFKIWFTLLT